MPLNISKLGKVLKTLNRVQTPNIFNASLPVKIEIKKELNPITYLIQLGNKEVETKSYVPLKVGHKYLAQIKELKNSIQITNLKEFPKILDDLQKISLNENIDSTQKHEILKHLANANSKEEFLFWTNVLIAQQKKIYHFIIGGKRKAIMQYKYKKDKVKFYACFNNLGEIEGEIKTNFLTIYSPYDVTISLISQYKDELNMNIKVIKKDVKALYNFSNSLLDIKV